MANNTDFYTESEPGTGQNNENFPIVPRPEMLPGEQLIPTETQKSPRKLDGTIFVDENIPLLAEALTVAAEILRFNGRQLKRQELIDKNCRALIVRSTTKVNSGLLDGTPVLFVGTATSGIDHIDTDYLEKRGIHFEYAKGSNANSVAEYVVYSMLKWADIRKIQLNFQTIGIVGFGNIGSIVGRYAYYMGMRILVNDPPLMEAGYEFPDYIQYVQLDDIIRTSAVITNHVPITKEGKFPTYKLFGSKETSEIFEQSLFIHASRGYIVDETALIERLNKKDIYAAIDVWENEPLINKELARKTILSTPHTAGYSRDGKLRGSAMMGEALKKFFDISPNLEIIYKEFESYNPLPEEEFIKQNEFYERLRNSRKLDEDSYMLLETLGMPDEQRGDAFDRLRKNYQERREIL